MVSAPVLRHIDLPPGPGSKVVVVVPAGHEWLAVPGPLVPGCGFTLNLGEHGVWRAEVRIASEVKGEVGMELEITGRYPESEDGLAASRSPGFTWRSTPRSTASGR